MGICLRRHSRTRRLHSQIRVSATLGSALFDVRASGGAGAVPADLNARKHLPDDRWRRWCAVRQHHLRPLRKYHKNVAQSAETFAGSNEIAAAINIDTAVIDRYGFYPTKVQSSSLPAKKLVPLRLILTFP